ncbi:aspartyl protease family protein [Qipengyuania sphaerica]|uniref:aspartyl protease family protein n=1 Tax=Qipengyuania sphaerica TaxID=2867243 RepID=UPI001C86D023|nr:aspartyl protease family protein [Qipengyuania sphaerica]MBX7541249.1 aspartyl protease family protein [Qipengyuania sphaerica]
MAARSIVTAIALLLGSVTSAQSSAQPEAPVTEPALPDEDVIDIAFDRDRYERMTVPVTIAGQGPYRFFIDTGAQATVVTDRITDDLALEPSGRAMLVAMGSRRLVDTIAIDQLEFADRTLSGLTSPLLDRRNIGADGILGLDTLQDMRVLIDFEEDRISVADADTRINKRGYEIVVRARAQLGQMIITDARLNGVRTAVIIDTGAQNTVGNFALLKRMRARAEEKFTSTDVHGTQISGDVTFARSLKIGSMELSNVPIGFADSPALAALGYTDEPALILGMANLTLFRRVAIDFASREVLFDLPDSALPRDPVNLNWKGTRTRS